MSFRETDHLNVIKVLGQCVETVPYLVVLELCPFVSTLNIDNIENFPSHRFCYFSQFQLAALCITLRIRSWLQCNSLSQFKSLETIGDTLMRFLSKLCQFVVSISSKNGRNFDKNLISMSPIFFIKPQTDFNWLKLLHWSQDLIVSVIFNFKSLPIWEADIVKGCTQF